jgi:hypothetical protein
MAQELGGRRQHRRIHHADASIYLVSAGDEYDGISQVMTDC